MSSLADTRSFGPASSPVPQLFTMLDSAAEQMMVHRDFHAAFDICDKGLESLASAEHQDDRCAELKAGLCTVGIQALAELNQWPGVLSWVLQQYEDQERIPAKIMQMCILLYSKVGEPAVMQEAARDWLHCRSNSSVTGFGTVAELYLLHVLLPLGHRVEALELINGEVGGNAFTEDQRRTALDIVEEKQQQSPDPRPDPTIPDTSVPTQGHIARTLEAMLRFFHRKLSLGCSGSLPIRKLFLAAVLLYMLFFRLDPAHPSSFMWISKLVQLIKQMWRAMFAPYYQAVTHSKEL